MTRRAPAAQVRLTSDPERREVPRTGAVESVQCAEVTVPEQRLAELWRPESLERLARAYWRYLSRISLGLLRVVYEPESRTVVLGLRPLALLRFHAPDYEIEAGGGSVTWRIDRGLLVARDGRGRGFLQIEVERREGGPPGFAVVAVRVAVANFYPWLRGSGAFARLGTWLYGQTQVRLHVIVTHGFLRSLARLDLPPSRIGALRGEIDAGGEAARAGLPDGV